MQDIWEPTVWSKNIVEPYVPTDIMIKREQADAGKEARFILEFVWFPFGCGYFPD